MIVDYFNGQNIVRLATFIWMMIYKKSGKKSTNLVPFYWIYAVANRGAFYGALY